MTEKPKMKVSRELLFDILRSVCIAPKDANGPLRKMTEWEEAKTLEALQREGIEIEDPDI